MFIICLRLIRGIYQEDFTFKKTNNKENRSV